MTTVYGTLRGPGQRSQPGRIDVRMVGYSLRTDGVDVLGQDEFATADDGTWSRELLPNTDAAPYYVVSATTSTGFSRQYLVRVPDTAARVSLSSIEVQLPLPKSASPTVRGPAGPPGTSGTGGGTGVDATATTKGAVRLAGALGGTALSPTALGLASADALLEAIQDTVASMVRAGSNTTLNYDDAAGTLTFNAIVTGGTGGGTGGSTDPEVVRDAIGAALVGGANLQVTVNDAADTITLAVTGLATVARSGAYSDLSGLPTIPAAPSGYRRTAVWNSQTSTYAVLGTTVTDSNRVPNTYYEFLLGPDPRTITPPIGMIVGDAWKTTS